MKKLTIGHLYPDLLNLYGDRGNIQCFRKRLEWRGMEAEVIPFLSGEKIDFSKLDIVLLGGGSDREQELVCGFLKDIKDDFKAYVEDGGVVLAVCGGYQLLGKYYKTNKKTIEGLSILDITTEWQPERLIRNIVLNSPLFEQPVVGFENHGANILSSTRSLSASFSLNFLHLQSGYAADCKSALFAASITFLDGPRGLIFTEKSIISPYVYISPPCVYCIFSLLLLSYLTKIRQKIT